MASFTMGHGGNPNRKPASHVADDDDPICEVCGEAFPPRRFALGYRTCLTHGEARKTYTAVPVPKSNYIIATSLDQVLSPYSHKGNR